MSVRPFHCTSLPGKTNGMPRSLQIAAWTAIVMPMFIALPTAKPTTVWERWTLHEKPCCSADAHISSSWA